MPRCSAYHAASSSGRSERKKTPPMPTTRSLTAEVPDGRRVDWSCDALRRAHELGEHGPVRAELVEARVLSLRRVRDGDGEVRSRADVTGNGLDPLDQLLDARARRQDIPACEVDQLAGKPVANRAPGVLLDQAMRQRRERLAVVNGACEPGSESVDQRRERLRLAEI